MLKPLKAIQPTIIISCTEATLKIVEPEIYPRE